ncbi:MAG: peptide chain release factor N(5)-glutamine methyltransferase [Acetatifactor sp.]|nr:peptide chain release factor N(5)-glutamine methyltransferase [Acetatifactor sp.]
MNYRECFEKGKGALADAGIEEAALDARLLLEHICGTDRNTLLVHGDRTVSPEEEKQYLDAVERRSRRIPLQQITGQQEFMGLPFWVNSNVLIPRQDTEVLVEEVLKHTHDGMQILDMCTGSGCILISILHYSNDCEGLGVDISSPALEVAEENAERLLSGRTGVSARFLQSDLFEAVDGKYDILVSNPPYIRSAVVDTLMPEVKDYEPRIALDGEEDGLVFYRRILSDCKKNLKKGGMLFFEIGYDQAEAVKGMMEQAGFLEVTVKKDFGGLDRVVFGTLGFGAL